MPCSKSLPPEFTLQTLLKLPVKTLTRFKVVSKQWRSVISNPTFVALHAKLSGSTNNGYLVQYKECHYSQNNFARYDKNLIRYEEMKFPINPTQIVGSCKGLVCLLLNTYKSCQFPMFVWNPSTRKCKKIPSHKSFGWEKKQFRCSANLVWGKEMKGSFATFAITGFGYDHKTSDFKILLVVHAREIASEQFHHREFNEVQVYSLKCNSWRRIQANNIACLPSLNSRLTVYLNGAVYWMAIRRENDGSRTEIFMSFDFGNEVFRERMLPDHYYHLDHGNASIGILKELISLFAFSPGEDYRAELGVCDVYVMKENGVVENWIHLFTVDLRAQFARQYLGFGANGELMLRNDDGGELVLYDHETGEIVQCGSSNWVTDAVTYTESLISP